MDRDTAAARLRAILGEAADALDADLIDAALDQAVTLDSEGRRPSDPEWTPTFDPWWAAGVVSQILAARAATAGGILRWTSEGVTVERRAPDFASAAAGFFDLSPISRLLGSQVQRLTVPGPPRYRPRSEDWR